MQQERIVMFQLSKQDIHLGVASTDKQSAIRQVAAALNKAGCINSAYVDGMLQRELQTSTYLGNGIAIPHGTTNTHNLVLKTGVQVFQYPQGIDWGSGETAYIVIGIAARSNEHLVLLRQLTHVLSNDSISQQLAQTLSVDKLHSLLMGKQDEFRFDISLITLDINTDKLMTLQAINAGNLYQIDAVNAHFINAVLTNHPLHLGQGIWFSDSHQGALINAATVSRPKQIFDENGKKVRLLLTLSVANIQSLVLLNYLSDLLIANEAEQLLHADAATILSLLTSPLSPKSKVMSAEYVIRNEHGLHARPGTTLVNIIKQFNSEITVTNLDGNGKSANGRSLIKVVALGVQKGHHLRFIANGEDAQAMLQAIGQAINVGLGEDIE